MGRSEPDAYRRVAHWYDLIFGELNAGLRGLGLKMLPPREGMEVLMPIPSMEGTEAAQR